LWADLTPGNPGVLDYYTPFVELLRESIPDGHAILCTSHVGGDMRIAGPAEPLGLMENLDTKVECAAALRDSLSAWAAETRAPIPKLSVMGHSIGAWLCVEVMKRVRIDAAYLLFPTLGWIANSWNGWKLWVSEGENVLTIANLSPSHSTAAPAARECGFLCRAVPTDQSSRNVGEVYQLARDCSSRAPSRRLRDDARTAARP
jgi:hypothetical protein